MVHFSVRAESKFLSTMFVHLFLAILISSVTAESGHPKFDPDIEHIALEEGSLEMVECVAKGELPLTYTWYNKNDVEISADKKQDVFTRQSKDGCFLVFAAVKPSHAGYYTCSATNKHGTATKPYDIIVNTTIGNITAKEVAEITSVRVVRVTEDRVEFLVLTKGDPDSFYIGYKEILEKENWVQIKKGEKAEVKYLVPAGGYTFWFQIENPSQVKRWLFPCNVTLLPSVPDVIFRKVKDGLVDVEWFRSIDDLTRRTILEYELTYYTVQQIQYKYWEPSDCEITVSIPRRSCAYTRYTIAGLVRGLYYEIRVRVRTEAGFGLPYVNKVYIDS